MSPSHLRPARGLSGRSGSIAAMMAVLGAVTIAAGALAADTSPPASPLPSPSGRSPGVVLHGPWGSLPGMTIEAGRLPPDPVGVPILDTWGRDPGLVIQTRDPDAAIRAWHVDAVPIAQPGADPVVLASGTAADAETDLVSLVAPSPGDWLVHAHLDADGEADGDHAWHLRIPDRAIPAGGPPAPDLILFGGGDTIVAARGSGCFVGTCGDIGREPPLASLPRLHPKSSEAPIVLTLSDGTDLAGVHVSARRGDRNEEVIVLADGDLPPGINALILPALPGAGQWRVEIHVQFDQSRGDQTGYLRVAIP